MKNMYVFYDELVKHGLSWTINLKSVGSKIYRNYMKIVSFARTGFKKKDAF